MTITEILNSDEDNNVKLTSIATLVEKVRKSYGNTEDTIEMPELTTTEGLLVFSLVSEESKLAILDREVSNMKMQAYEDVKHTPGMSLVRRVEELVATNPFLANLHVKESLGVL